MALGCPLESGADQCSQPTMSRLENLPTTALKRMMAAMFGGGSRPSQDQRLKRPAAQMSAMDPASSSPWMDPLEPELEVAMLNRYAGRAGSGRWADTGTGTMSRRD